MHHWTVHAKVEFQKFPPDVRYWGVHSMEWTHSQDLTLFSFCCVHHRRSFLMKDQLGKENSPIVCAVLALDSWNYCSGEQA